MTQDFHQHVKRFTASCNSNYWDPRPFDVLWDICTLIQIHGLLFFKTNCCCMQIYLRVNTYISKYNLFCLLLFTCVFSEMTIWHRANNFCALTSGEPSPMLLASFTFLQFFMQGWSFLGFSPSICHVHRYPSFPAHICHHIGETIWVQLLMVLGNTISQQTSRSSGS